MKKKTTGAVSGAMIDAMQAAKPSPLPWVESDGTEIKDSRGILCAIASGFHLSYPEAVENRALIVRAVNAHAGLVEALRVCIDALNCTEYEGGEATAKARAALRAAGEAV